MSKVQIIGESITNVRILIDGAPVEGVSYYELSQKAGEIPELRLTIPAQEIEINTPCLPVLPEIYRAFYERKTDTYGHVPAKE